MDYKLLIDTAVLAGELMLCSGAETYRVEDTMRHILKTSEAENIDVLVLLTGITASISGEHLDMLTVVRRVLNRGTNLSTIVKVNDISRRYCGSEISLNEANQELKSIDGKQYSSIIYNIGIIMITVGFALMFKGSITDICITAAVGTLLAFVITMGKKIAMNIVILETLASFFIAFATIGLDYLLSSQVHTDIVIISSIMPLVPGVAITNAVRDTLQGDYLSGGARIMEAFLKAISIALGIGIGMAMIHMIGKGAI